MARFSERQGYRPVKTAIQVETMDDDLRNGLWDATHVLYWSRMRADWLTRDPEIQSFCQQIWHSFFKRPLDTLENYWPDALKAIRTFFFDCEWFEVYDFLEFLASNFQVEGVNDRFRGMCNKILEREVAGYRFVNKWITPITSEEELSSLEDALEPGGTWSPVTAHLQRALGLLSDRQAPDYRNSIKESISAVESACSLVVGSKATLGSALDQLESRVATHPALKEAFKKLYGYTSDAGGVRHALLGESTLDFADAKFMLVACSAFVNYLRGKLID